LMMEHVSWEGDALLVTVPKHKGDQEGSNSFARHLYANTTDPVICPVLALAVLVFTRVMRFDPAKTAQPTDSSSAVSLPNYRVFDGNNSESRFSGIFRKALESLSASEAQQVGGSKRELGTHSVRKGAATYCHGMVNGPSHIHISLRAGWALGGVRDRYIFGGAGGDQLTGRALAGLPFNEAAFASLPPHFDTVGAAQVAWSTAFPMYSSLPDTFKRALPFLLASICHHESWLRSTLSANHPLFLSPLFASGMLESLRVHVLTACYRSPLTGLTATGIPPHLAMSNELTAVMRETEAMKVQLLSQYASLPSDVVTTLMNKFVIQGAIPVTVDDIKALLTQAVSEMNTHMRNALPDSARASAPAAAADTSNDEEGYRRWVWGRPKRSFHPVPEGWRLVSTDVMSTWRLWHFGIPADQIGPLRRLHAADLVDKAQKTQLSKTKGVMDAITAQLISMGVVESELGIGRLSQDEATTAFTQAIVAVMEQMKPRSTQKRGRWNELRLPTLYGHVKTQEEKERQKDEAEKRRREQAEASDSEDERPAQRRRLEL
jgi:hypothetical protein